jgi:DNA-binding CsgD family transcriptional regulator
MLQPTLPSGQPLETPPPPSRHGDVSAMLRMMGPLNGGKLSDPIVRRRRLLADLCRLVGVSVGTVAAVPAPPPSPVERGDAELAELNGELSPRLEQTLGCLLAGASEKQVASHLKLSRHTVHVYVKALYRRYGVSSRAELLAKHLKR